MIKIYTNAHTAPILSALHQKLAPQIWETEGGVNNNGRFGFERSLPEKPAWMNASLRTGMRMTVKMNAAREKPTEACSGWPSLLKMRAPETASPASVSPEMRIGLVDGILTFPL